MSFDDFPVLRLRADGPTATHLTELSIDGVSLLQWATDITVTVKSGDLVTATLTVECTPDMELPASVVVQRRDETSEKGRLLNEAAQLTNRLRDIYQTLELPYQLKVGHTSAPIGLAG